MALALILVVIGMAVSLHVERSRFGMALLAIKQNEPAAEAAGIDAWRWKMRAMTLSAAMAAAAGGLYAIVLLVVTPPTVFGMLVSAQALIVTLFGGVGVFWGPIIGATVLVPLAETLHAELGHIIPGIQGVVYGFAIIAIILLAPDGIYWRIRDRVVTGRAESRPAWTDPPPGAGRAAPDDAWRWRAGTAGRAGGPPARERGAPVRWPPGRRRRHPDHPGRRDPRDHRAQRRRQDDPVQRRQRIPRRRCRQHPVPRPGARGAEAA
jgi:branched-chain amino acid transport system permease protein